MDIKKISVTYLLAIFAFLVLSGMGIKNVIIPMFNGSPIYEPIKVDK